MKRRGFLAGMTAAAFVIRAHAQARLHRVAVIGVGDPNRPPFTSLVEGLRELGYVEGRNLELGRPMAGDDPDGSARARLAAAAVARKTEVIVAWGTTAARAISKVTTTIPVVLLTGTDPSELGLVRNLARPEGNITGIAYGSAMVVEKQMELLKEIVPGTRRLGVLLDPASGSRQQAQKNLAQAAKRLGFSIHVVEVGDPTALPEITKALAVGKPDALYAMPSNRFGEYRNEIVQIAAVMRLPAAYSSISFVRAGGLFYYGADSSAVFRRAAFFVDRLLKGAKPAELPFEQPTKFELALNLRAARLLGLSIPSGVLVRAGEVIK